MDNSRREFFKKAISFFPALIGMGMFLDSCNSGDNNKNTNGSSNEKKDNNSTNKTSAVSCDDLSGLNANDLATRKNLSYVEVTPMKNKTCKLCALFLSPQNGGDCGGCTVIRGPIRSTGTCVYWAKKEI